MKERLPFACPRRGRGRELRRDPGVFHHAGVSGHIKLHVRTHVSAPRFLKRPYSFIRPLPHNKAAVRDVIVHHVRPHETAANGLIVHSACPYENGCEKADHSTSLPYDTFSEANSGLCRGEGAITANAGNCGIIPWSDRI